MEQQWAPYQTPDGRLYFYNQQTGESSWERPQAKNYPLPVQRPNVGFDQNIYTTGRRDIHYSQNTMGMSNPQTNAGTYYQQSVPPMGNFVIENSMPPREYHAPQDTFNTYHPGPSMRGYDQNPNQYREPQQMPQVDRATVPPMNHVPEDQGSNDLLQYLDGFNKRQQPEPTPEVNPNQHQSRRPPPGMQNRPNRPPPGFQKSDPTRKRPHNVQLTVTEKRYGCGDIVLAKWNDGNNYPAKIANVLADAYVVDWLDMNDTSTVSHRDVSPMPKREEKPAGPPNSRKQRPQSQNTHQKRPPAKSRSTHPRPAPHQSKPKPKPKPKPTKHRPSKDSDNWGAVRQIKEIGKWQARTPEGDVLPQLFNTCETATEFLRRRKREEKKTETKKERPTKRNMHERYPSPPAYIPPMPADLYSDDEDEEEEEEHIELERPIGREVVCDPCGDIERIAVTSSVELQSVYEQGFEEWKPKQPWAYDDVSTRTSIRMAFRQNLYRTAIFTATGIVYTELLPEGEDELTVGGIIFTKHRRTPDKPKFPIRLQHALEHQLALALHRANFTRIAGETTPMYVFMSQTSGKELKLQGGKDIINYCGVVPHVKLRSPNECHLEMVPAEKSFLKRTLRDLCVNGKQKSYYKDTRGLVRTREKLLTVTIVNISSEQSHETKDPTTGLTVRQMAKKRGMTLGYNDAVVVETTHGLFSSDEIHPSARLSKKEQASRDKNLGKHKYCDRQAANFKIVEKFKSELCESIKRNNIGLRASEHFIEAPCTYLPEVQIRRATSNGKGESIGSKSRHHEWDRLLKKCPSGFEISSFIMLIDRSFHREKSTLQKLMRAVIKRRPWLPEPNLVVTDLNEIAKIWTSRQTNVVCFQSDKPLDQRTLSDYFGEFGMISSIKVSGTSGTITFRTPSCVPLVLGKDHAINGVRILTECCLKMNRHQQKQCGEGLAAIKEAEALVVFLPGKEGASRVTHMKNKLTMLINGEEGLNHGPLQFIMQCHIRRDSRKSLAILQEALEAGLVPKCGAITFEIDRSRAEFDLIIAIDVSQERSDAKVASVVATTKPFEGSIKSMRSLVSLVNTKGCKGDVIPYDQMKQILTALGKRGENILIYRHNCSVEYKEVFNNEIQGAMDFFTDSHITFIEVTSSSSLRILDVPFKHLGNRQARGEFIITKKVTQTWKKTLEFHIRHIEKSNPVKYSIIYSTNRSLLTSDAEVLNVATFTHNLTKNYVHHKDGSKLPGPLKYADHNARLYASIMKTIGIGKSLPKFHGKALRPKII